MSASCVIVQSLIQAYRQTEYRVLGNMPMVLQVDVVSPALADLHRALNVDCSAFITAFNAHSLATESRVNLERQGRLTAELALRGLMPVEATGIHPAGQWPAEPSFLVPGLRLAEARHLGVQFAQNAILWTGVDAVPRLILLR